MGVIVMGIRVVRDENGEIVNFFFVLLQLLGVLVTSNVQTAELTKSRDI